ncbi:hypothetical protein AB0F17_35380 [Nonomuraea sp. NPDC026600]|uniref:hypothetical protein n=1 Tax=Nonomuraea sp. NPDC026600 TaxID=3155363 RepID=UPI0033DA092A
MTATMWLLPGLRPADTAAEQLQDRLHAAHRIASEVRHGDGVALVLISTDLVVWTDGGIWWWWTGHTTGRGRWIYNHASTANVATAARRIALRHAELHGGEQSWLKERIG